MNSESFESGYLEFHRKDNKPPFLYRLKMGSNKIGTSLSDDIRIKSTTEGSVLCIVNVKDNGLATLENPYKHPIHVNGAKMSKVKLLKNDDIFVVANKQFRYINNHMPTDVPQSIRIEKRQSVMPSFRLKTPSKIPVSIKKSTLRRSFSADRKVLARRSCAMPEKRRSRLYEWETIATPRNRNLLRPSTSMQQGEDLSVSVRKSLFIRNKGDLLSTSKKSGASLLTLEDSVCVLGESRGLKRRRDSSLDSLEHVNKRPKPSSDRFVFLSVSGCESLLDSSSDCEESPLVTALYTMFNRTFPSKSSLNSLTDVKLLQTPTVLMSVRNELADSRSGRKTPKVHTSKPQNDLTNVKGVRKLLRTPKVQKSPQNDLTDIRGVKKLMTTPKEQKSPLNDLTNVRGVKKLLRTPKVQKPPKNDLTEVRGVKKLMKTPKEQKSPRNDLTKVRGVKKLLRTPKVQKSPKNDLTDVRGVKKLMKTPKEQKSPLNDLTEVRGVKKLLRTPKVQKSPKNDLTDVRGVKKLLRTPKEQKSPLNDLTNVSGVKKLLRTPKAHKSPQNDLTEVRGVKKLMKTPRELKSPLNDLSKVGGVKKLLKTPRVQKPPKNDLSDLEGVQELFSDSIVSIKTPQIEEVQLSQRGRRIRRKNLDEDFVGSPKPGDELVRSLRQRTTRQKTAVDEQVSITSTPNLESGGVVEMSQKRGRGKKSAVVEEEEAGGSPNNVTETVEVGRRAGRGRVVKNVDEEEPKKRGGRRMVQNEQEETPTQRRTRKRKVQSEEESSVVEDKVQSRGRRGKVEEKALVVEGKNNDVQNKGRGRRKLLREEALISEEVKNGVEESTPVEQKRPRRGAQKKESGEDNVETPKVAKTRSKKNVVDDVPKEEKKTRGRKRKDYEENEVANVIEVTEESSKSPVKNRRRGVKKVEAEVPESVDDTNVQRTYNTRSRRERK